MEVPLAFQIAARSVLAIAGIALAAFTYRASPRATLNRLLACFLLLIALGAATTPIRHVFPDGFEREMWSHVAFRAFGVAPFALLLGIVGTLGVPLARPFATRAGVAISYGLAVGILVWAFVFPGWMIAMTLTPSGWTAGYAPGVAGKVNLAISLAALYAALVGLQALRRAPRRSLERTRAIALLAGLALLTLVSAINGAAMWIMATFDPAFHDAYMDSPSMDVFPIAYTLSALAGIIVLAVGMLRVQLLDVDLRVKWTIERGTLVAIAVATIVLVAELAQIWVSSTLGVIAGIVVAVGLIFLKRPLERAAQRVADVAMPNVQDTPEWREDRKGELYQTAVRLALADGTVNEEEERQLAQLAAQLGLDELRARGLRHAVERDVRPTS